MVGPHSISRVQLLLEPLEEHHLIHVIDANQHVLVVHRGGRAIEKSQQKEEGRYMGGREMASGSVCSVNTGGRGMTLLGVLRENLSEIVKKYEGTEPPKDTLPDSDEAWI